MEPSLLSLIKTYVPSQLYVNENGVITRYLKYDVSKGNITLMFSLFSENGIWGGAISLFMCSTWGMGHPLTLDDAKFSTLEDCMADLWNYLELRVSLNEAFNNSKVIKFIKSERKKWDSIPSNEKINYLKINSDLEF